jgi:hypothetical protein
MGSRFLALKHQANQIPPFQGGPHRPYPRVGDQDVCKGLPSSGRLKHSEAAPEWYGYCTELTRNCPPSQCPSTASASFYCGFGRLITKEK